MPRPEDMTEFAVGVHAQKREAQKREAQKREARKHEIRKRDVRQSDARKYGYPVLAGGQSAVGLMIC